MTSPTCCSILPAPLFRALRNIRFTSVALSLGLVCMLLSALPAPADRHATPLPFDRIAVAEGSILTGPFNQRSIHPRFLAGNLAVSESYLLVLLGTGLLGISRLRPRKLRGKPPAGTD
jgi:hypothetical protein